ncbi:MAG: cation:proton antiporter [Candidatus Marinimicrobia bacterium]|nr:cation:proton antiporter [Candidatus Neomarinimicrobiota bacterium]
MDSLADVFNNLKDLFGHHVVFGTGILLLSGYFLGKLAEKVKLPAITGYILAGLLLSKSMISIIPETAPYKLNSITEIALGMIAITIGAEFEFSRIKQIGRSVLVMTIFEGVFAYIFVTGFFILIGMKARYAFLLGAIAPATAPAATVVILRESKARGQFVDILYGIVALDDALCIILFSITFALVGPVITGQLVPGTHGFFHGLFMALEEIGLSVLLGLISGFSMFKLTRRRYKLNEILIISIGIIFISTSVAIMGGLSHLIVNMVAGAVLVNTSSKNKRVFKVIEPLTPPLFALFFVLAGTELELGVITNGIVVVYGLVYIVSRSTGKYMGIYSSAILCKMSVRIRKYLGFCLFPQAGVAIGLVLFVQTSPLFAGVSAEIREILVLIVNIVLFSILINELIGAPISRFGISKGADFEK